MAKQEDIDAIKALIASGDVDLDDSRAIFKHETGRDTILNDELLIEAIAETDDDDVGMFVANVQRLETDVAIPAEMNSRTVVKA